MPKPLIAGFAGVAIWLVVAASSGVQGCASVSAPRGGPPDTTPPTLLLVEPDSYAVVTEFRGSRGSVRFEFDEPISERNILGVALVYPFDRRPEVDKGKRDLKVRPRIGWVEDRIYHVRVQPQLQDYFNNSIPDPIDHVISTGLPIPDNRMLGVVYDRITGQVHRSARFDAVHLPDTLRYGALADTSGRFTLAALPPGDYLAIGYEDVNNNLRADEFDRSDTVRVSLAADDTLTLEFQVFKHDTLGPVLSEIELLDSMTLSLGFDGYLDPEAQVGVANVEIVSRPDSTALDLEDVMHQWRYQAYQDSIRQAEQARRDSLAAAEAAAEAAADTGAVPQEPSPVPTQRPTQRRTDREPTRGQEQPTVSGPLPDQRIIVFLASPIAPGSYVVRVSGIVNLSGLTGGGVLDFEREAPEGETEEPPPDPSDGEGAR